MVDDSVQHRDDRAASTPLLVIFERDVGLFSLFQQVVANIPRALANGAVPVACFGSGSVYFRPEGYRERDTVWEYYFEPLVDGYDASVVDEAVRDAANRAVHVGFTSGFEFNDRITLTNSFGHHRELCGQTLRIPYELEDPNAEMRESAAQIIQQFVRPRQYIRDKVAAWHDRELGGGPFVGVHVRGTDAISSAESRPFRQGSYQIPKTVAAIKAALSRHRQARVLVATDDSSSLAALRDVFGDRIVTYASIRHESGAVAGKGPKGGLVPAYISNNPDIAALNGEEAIIEYLLLCRSAMLIHNGASLARTVLLTEPSMSHVNTHGQITRKLRATWYLRQLFDWRHDGSCPQVPPGLDLLLERSRTL